MLFIIDNLKRLRLKLDSNVNEESAIILQLFYGRDYRRPKYNVKYCIFYRPRVDIFIFIDTYVSPKNILKP